MQYSFIKDKISKGWSYPLKRDLLDNELNSLPKPLIHSVYYLHCICHDFEKACVFKSAFQGSFDLLYPNMYSLCVYSVPSTLKKEISCQIQEIVLPHFISWISSLEAASPTKRSWRHVFEYIYSNGSLIYVTEAMRRARPKYRLRPSKQYFTGK